MDYIGEKCPVCGEVFTAEDDIVVCPECGTPHHRACYAVENKCANAAEHSTGKKWERSDAEKENVRICPVCHFQNSRSALNCQRCGTELKDIEPVRQEDIFSGEREQRREPFVMPEELADPIKFLGLDEKEDMGGATMKEVSDFVGVNTFYYLPRFKRIKDDGLKPSFNFISLIFPSLYFASRKMWLWAVIAAFLGILFNLPANLLIYGKDMSVEFGKFVTDNKQMISSISEICLGLDMAARALSCFFANWLYFRFTLRTIKKNRNGGRPSSALGGVKPMNMLIITLIKGCIGFLAIFLLYFFFDMLTTISDFSTL